jgi:hypothetical protein
VDLPRGIAGQIFPTHYMSDPLVGIVHHDGKLVGPQAITPFENEVPHLLGEVLVLQAHSTVFPRQSQGLSG